MIGSRSLYYHLVVAFNKNSEVKKKACQSSKQTLKKHPELINRIFDHFPCLISDKLLQKKTDQFKEIINSIDESSISDDMVLKDEIAKTKIALFEKSIAKMAVEELLTYEEKIKPELLKLLEWEEYETLLNKPDNLYSILCAYVGAINQAITEHFGKKPEKSNEMYGAIGHYINQNTRKWILEKVDKTGSIAKHFDTNTKWKYEKILTWPIDPPKTGVLVVLTAVAAAAAILFFKKSSNEEPPTETTEWDNSFRI